MNGYIMFGRQLECHVVDEPHRDTFKNGNREWKFVPTQLQFRKEKNRPRDDTEKAAKVNGLLEKETDKRRRLKELGIEYDFPGYAAIVQGVKDQLMKEAKAQVVQEQKKKTAEKKQSPISNESSKKKAKK